MTLDHLGCEVVNGADEQSRARHRTTRHGLLRETEICEVSVGSLRWQEDVCSLDVAVYEPVFVSCIECACDL